MNWVPVYNIHPLLVHKHIRDIENNKKKKTTKITPINYKLEESKKDNDLSNKRSFWSFLSKNKKD